MATITEIEDQIDYLQALKDQCNVSAMEKEAEYEAIRHLYEGEVLPDYALEMVSESKFAAHHAGECAKHLALSIGMGLKAYQQKKASKS